MDFTRTITRGVLSEQMRLGTSEITATGYEIATRWAIENPLTCVAVIIPTQVACSIIGGCFSRLMFCRRQLVHGMDRLFADWPPAAFMKRRQVQYLEPLALANDDAVRGLDELQRDLVRWRTVEPSTCRYELATCRFEPATCRYEPMMSKYDPATCRYETNHRKMKPIVKFVDA